MCLDADDYCPYEVPDAQPTKKVEPQGRIWKCLDGIEAGREDGKLVR